MRLEVVQATVAVDNCKFELNEHVFWHWCVPACSSEKKFPTSIATLLIHSWIAKSFSQNLNVLNFITLSIILTIIILIIQLIHSERSWQICVQGLDISFPNLGRSFVLIALKNGSSAESEQLCYLLIPHLRPEDHRCKYDNEDFLIVQICFSSLAIRRCEY